MLVQSAAEVDYAILDDASTVGVSAGASAPEVLVEKIIDALAERYDISVEAVTSAEETITFTLPRTLRDVA